MIGIAIFDDKKETIHLTWYKNDIDITSLRNVAYMVYMFSQLLIFIERDILDGTIPDIPKGFEPRETDNDTYDWFKDNIN